MGSPEQHLPNPGVPHDLPDMRALIAFEDALVATQLPPYHPDTPRMWNNRDRLDSLILPNGFFGRTGLLMATLLVDPYEELVEDFKPARQDPDWGSAHTTGFRVGGQLFKPGSQEPVGVIDARVFVWQAPPRSKPVDLGEYRRRVTPNKQAQKAFLEARKAANEKSLLGAHRTKPSRNTAWLGNLDRT